MRGRCSATLLWFLRIGTFLLCELVWGIWGFASRNSYLQLSLLLLSWQWHEQAQNHYHRSLSRNLLWYRRFRQPRLPTRSWPASSHSSIWSESHKLWRQYRRWILLMGCFCFCHLNWRKICLCFLILFAVKCFRIGLLIWIGCRRVQHHFYLLNN